MNDERPARTADCPVHKGHWIPSCPTCNPVLYRPPTGAASTDRLVRERLRVRADRAVYRTPCLPGMDLASVRALLAEVDIREETE